ncbi:uncharacterized protein BKA55DRAFT_722989, partial [Fusarium redolens]
EHKVWKLFNWLRGSWPVIQGHSDFSKASNKVSAYRNYKLLQDKTIVFNASQSKDFNNKLGKEEVYSNDEDEDTDSMFGYDEVDRNSSEVIGNQAEVNKNRHADRASKMQDKSNMAIFIKFLKLLY